MVSQSQRDTRGDRSASGISCHCVRAIARSKNALAIHWFESSWTGVFNESITFCNLLSLRSLQRKSGELFQLLNERDIRVIYLKSPKKQWQTREPSQLLHALPQAVACPLTHIWEFKQTLGCRRALQKGCRLTCYIWSSEMMPGQTDRPAHFSTVSRERFLGAVLCTGYFSFSCFRVHWMGKVSTCGTNVTQHWI